MAKKKFSNVIADTVTRLFGLTLRNDVPDGSGGQRSHLEMQLPTKEPCWVELELIGTERSEYIVRHKGVVY
jgi:hypothetical protein